MQPYHDLIARILSEGVKQEDRTGGQYGGPTGHEARAYVARADRVGDVGPAPASGQVAAVRVERTPTRRERPQREDHASTVDA